MPREELIPARILVRERLGHLPDIERVMRLNGCPVIPSLLRHERDASKVKEVATNPQVGDIIVIDHGDSITLKRVRAITTPVVVTESAHVLGTPWKTLGGAVVLIKPSPKFSGRSSWENFVRALAARKGSSALLDIILVPRDKGEET